MKVDFQKGSGLVPAIVQDSGDGTVLMLGYMNEEAFASTLETGRVTFFSRSKNRLWTKGETSGHWLEVERVSMDCDGDAILVLARAHGPTCHTGSRSCFADNRSFKQAFSFLGELEGVIRERHAAADNATSYTAKLLSGGTRRIAQKVGEEATEVVLEAAAGDSDRIVSETADLVYHLMVLLEACGLSLGDVVEELERRHRD